MIDCPPSATESNLKADVTSGDPRRHRGNREQTAGHNLTHSGCGRIALSLLDYAPDPKSEAILSVRRKEAATPWQVTRRVRGPLSGGPALKGATSAELIRRDRSSKST